LSLNLFLNPVFKEAVADIEALGLVVTAQPTTNAKPYAVIGGRSNQRWWLVPLENGRVTASGLALFQPLLTSARYMKAVVVLLSLLGLSRFWVRTKVYIAGESALQQHYAPEKPLSYAYFTGTDSPHRKLAVQVMDGMGNIKGYEKISRNATVQTLIQYEAATLNYLQTLHLQTANIPKVLFSGVIADAYALLTDTLKTPKTKSVTQLQKLHLDFLQELAEKTAEPVQSNSDWLVAELQNRFMRIENRLTPEWKARLEKAIELIAIQKEGLGQPVMAHGDFTPWNTFVVDDKLYVFDWEYANKKCTAAYDMIHFQLSLSALQKQAISTQITQVSDSLCRVLQITPEAAAAHLLAYLCKHAMQYSEREPSELIIVENWDRQAITAKLIDSLLVGNAV
jgi:thiamine kinase-like enzyme